MRFFYLVQIVKLARLPIVFAVIPTFLVGVLFALKTGALFSLHHLVWGFGILFLIEIAASFANDYFDYPSDKYNKQFGFSGGSGVLLQNPELLPFAKWGSVGLFLLAIICTIVFTWVAAFPLWTIGYILVAVFFCWFYTAPPLRLVYRGLGELPHLLAGIMFPGWGYLLLTGTLTVELLIFAIPFGFLGLTVILNFEIPDREADMQGGKRNLVVSKGRLFSFIIIFILYLSTFLYFLALLGFRWYDEVLPLWVMLFLAFIPVLFSGYTMVKKPVQRETATPYAIRNAVAGFLATFLILLSLIVLPT
ncbi:MAG: prenyltransferase [Candidatus Thermoplasmatota archaeon]|nr:prenyltransferase [Candidatus Thermoplasmatota archaeon]